MIQKKKNKKTKIQANDLTDKPTTKTCERVQDIRKGPRHAKGSKNIKELGSSLRTMKFFLPPVDVTYLLRNSVVSIALDTS